MCGFAGFAFPPARAGDGVRSMITAMKQALQHRGPDDQGEWFDDEAGIAFGHRRLSILDPSPAGHQPMTSASGRFVLSFNGEIYNHFDIRALMTDGGAPTWRGHSDTETLVTAFDLWGVEETLKLCAGMFALSVWDHKTRTLILARDRMGEKPIYYGWWNNYFLFGSELKAFEALPGFSPPLDRTALALYFCHNAVPGPRTIYQGFSKLGPGEILALALDRPLGVAEPRISTYWSLGEVLKAPVFSGSYADAVDELEVRLSRAVKGQMLSDVPLGAFLSGGVDSSLIVALMQEQSARPVQTFSIGFEEQEYNEAPYAAAVARHLGTTHTEVIVTADDAMAIIPNLPEIWDEPFADSSQIPTALVARLARTDVTVSLSGDGGDELFGGYRRYALAHAIEQIPAPSLFASLFASAPMGAAVGALRLVPFGPAKMVTRKRLEALSQVLSRPTPLDRYVEQVYRPFQNSKIAQVAPPAETLAMAGIGLDRDYLTQISALDSITYLPNDILVKVDRAAMAVSLETRVPLLDHKVVELAFSLPGQYKQQGGVTKAPLRSLLYRRVPKALIERPKMGFGIPYGEWLRGPLREWASDLLSPQALARGDCYLNPAEVTRLWNEHLSREWNWEDRLWRILMFRSWQERHGYA